MNIYVNSYSGQLIQCFTIVKILTLNKDCRCMRVFFCWLLGKYLLQCICFWKVKHRTSDVLPVNAHVITRINCFSTILYESYMLFLIFKELSSREDNSEHYSPNTQAVVGWGLIVCTSNTYPKRFERLNYM
mgnify:CR=1 FL=1